jgi:hypothetical protein
MFMVPHSRTRTATDQWGAGRHHLRSAILRLEVSGVHIPRFLFRVKDRQIEEEARTMLDTLGITDVEVRRDDTILDAWLEDYKAMKTMYGLEEIQQYLEALAR